MDDACLKGYQLVGLQKECDSVLIHWKYIFGQQYCKILRRGQGQGLAIFASSIQLVKVTIKTSTLSRSTISFTTLNLRAYTTLERKAKKMDDICDLQ